MTKTFTYDDVVRYLYSETSPRESSRIEEALVSDSNLLAFYLDSLELQVEMDRLVRSPSDQSVENILLYSLLYSVSRPADLAV